MTTLLPPAFVINLDRSPERWKHAREQITPHVEAIHRVPAVDRNLLSREEIEDFRDRSRGTADRFPDLRMTPRVSTDYWAGSAAVFESHMRAMELASVLYDRFMIMEDDSTIRADLMAATPDLDPAKHGVKVWGGALKGGSYTGHRRRYEEWQQEPGVNKWMRLPRTYQGVRQRYQTTAYEMTAAQAERWVEICRANPQAYDSCWWVAMLEIDTLVPDIEVIYQRLDLGSDRSAHADRVHKKNSLLK